MEQKLAGVDFQTSDKHKQGGQGRERDSIRASILDEAAIVRIIGIVLNFESTYLTFL